MSERIDHAEVELEPPPQEEEAAESGEVEGEAESSEDENDEEAEEDPDSSMEDWSEPEPVHPIFHLVRQGDLAGVRDLLSSDRTALHQLDGTDHAPIHIPAIGREESSVKLEMVRLLLSQGALVNSRASDFTTPLHIACMMGREKMCELLLVNGARFDLTLDNGRETALHESQREDVVKTLIRSV